MMKFLMIALMLAIIPTHAFSDEAITRDRPAAEIIDGSKYIPNYSAKERKFFLSLPDVNVILTIQYLGNQKALAPIGPPIREYKFKVCKKIIRPKNIKIKPKLSMHTVYNDDILGFEEGKLYLVAGALDEERFHNKKIGNIRDLHNNIIVLGDELSQLLAGECNND
jgi:hypothetical protein